MGCELHDGATFGTAIIYTGYDIYNKKLYFKTINPYECYIDENMYGKVDTVFREFVLTARNLVEFFKDENLDKEYLEEAEKNPDTEYKILHAVANTNTTVCVFLAPRSFQSSSLSVPVIVLWPAPRCPLQQLFLRL